MKTAHAVSAVTLSILLLTASSAHAEGARESLLRWEGFDDAAFQRAKREKKLVLLDLEAVWCHWCHVMDEITYHDPAVVELLKAHYVTIRVDQDSRPDLANRYEDYGWPATIVLDASGNDLARRSGYIPPRPMASMLKAFADDPTPGPSVTDSNLPSAEYGLRPDQDLGPELLKELEASFVDSYDFEKGSWGTVHKFLHGESVEYALMRAGEGDARAERMARQTLDAQRALIDPVWGGVYQYSTGGDWNEPHFEKIMSMQAENLRIYSLAFARFGDETYRRAANDVRRYLTSILRSPDGAFYTSQDADVTPGEHSAEYFAKGDAERRAIGFPRVDTNVYARENGWAIAALAAFGAATGDAAATADAVRAARWIQSHRAVPGGGFRHGEAKTRAFYLNDTLAMGRAFLALYTATGERSWLRAAMRAADFVGRTFPDLATSNQKGSRPQHDETVQLARFANLLFHHSGRESHRALARKAMRWLVNPVNATRRPTASVLLANAELSRDPVHLTIVGRKDDAAARALYRAAAAYPTAYKRVDFLDRREGPLPASSTDYPDLPRAAAFSCSEGRCSAPAYRPEDVRVRVDGLRSGLS